MQSWIVKKGYDRRIRAGHPWVFSNELGSSPKNIEPGAPVKLIDPKGDFLAWGYGNPKSLISFRAVSFKPSEESVLSPDWLSEKIISAWEFRHRRGYRFSFRLVYSEADSLPGLIIDYYTCETSNKKIQVFSCQILTSGIERAAKNLEEILKSVIHMAYQKGLTLNTWENTAIILCNDSSVRQLEGMNIEEPKVLKSVEGFDPENAKVKVASDLYLKTNFIEGQKTGLFLDQSFNIELVSSLLSKSLDSLPETVRILDLCCYIGAWSVHLSHFLKQQGKKVEVTLVDASQTSLKLAQQNVESLGVTVNAVHGDVLEDLGDLKSNSYDIVISDPPAFIKSKKDIHQGMHGYMKLNNEALRLSNFKGLLVACSCSGLLSEEEFSQTLAKASRRSGKPLAIIARGGHAPDHPVLHSFPEGRYLKMFVMTGR